VFTGIVEETGTVMSLGRDYLEVSARSVLEGSRLGDSIAVEGVCLTVTRMGDSWFRAGLMPETMQRTTLGRMGPGKVVNLERALTLGSRLGGHFVQGHIDGVGTVYSKRPDQGAILFRISASTQLLRYIVEKGFIAVDGASLTVTNVNEGSFSVSLVPYTQDIITLTGKSPGDDVNLEADILAKYIEKLSTRSSSGVTLDLLTEHGFGL
jgi:riboflavin synthase